MMKPGVDIIDVKRIARLISNDKFLDKVYTEEEINYCATKKNKAQHFAVRFAAKEAVWKALREKGLTLKEIGVKNMSDGKPEVFIRGEKRANIEISLSHTEDFAVAVAITE